MRHIKKLHKVWVPTTVPTFAESCLSGAAVQAANNLKELKIKTSAMCWCPSSDQQNTHYFLWLFNINVHRSFHLPHTSDKSYCWGIFPCLMCTGCDNCTAQDDVDNNVLFMSDAFFSGQWMNALLLLFTPLRHTLVHAWVHTLTHTNVHATESTITICVWQKPSYKTWGPQPNQGLQHYPYSK